MKALSLILGLLTLSGTTFAQQVTMRGKVEDVQQTQNQFFLDCTNTDLTSSIFELNTFVGMQVELTGQWNGSIANPSVHVEAIQVIPEDFEIGGGLKIGETSSLAFTGTPGRGALGYLSTGSAFIPFRNRTSVIFINPAQIVLRDLGVIGADGTLQLDFNIPNDPSLIGMELFGQGAFVGGGLGAQITNPDCKEISD